jgi:hypothetical protein
MCVLTQTFIQRVESTAIMVAFSAMISNTTGQKEKPSRVLSI